MSTASKIYTEHSVFIEQMVEHEFISRVTQYIWFNYRQTIEVLHSEIDAYGYDIILEFNGILRHIQLKTSSKGTTTDKQKINIALSKKTGGCVIWIIREEDSFNQRFNFEYLYFGGKAGEPMPNIDNFKTAKANKANSQGIKSERPNIKEVRKAQFTKIKNLEELIEILFGEQPNDKNFLKKNLSNAERIGMTSKELAFIDDDLAF